MQGICGMQSLGFIMDLTVGEHLLCYFQSDFLHNASFFLLEPSTIFQGLFGSAVVGINPSSGATGHTSSLATE